MPDDEQRDEELDEPMEVILGQCRKPTGELGMRLARRMNRSHHPLAVWGLSHLPQEDFEMVLDVGCGGGNTISLLGERIPGRLHGLDYSMDMVEHTREHNQGLVGEGRLEVLQGNVSRLPFRDSHFDLVTGVETYYFWPDLDGDLREVRRVLRPGGILVLINAVYRHPRFEERNAQWAEMADFHYHTPSKLRRLLKAAGFSRVTSDEVEKENWLVVMGRA
ncbi:MAG: class I SAM-dependent methyltransferase [Methanomassiliicoccales archaeon]